VGGGQRRGRVASAKESVQAQTEALGRRQKSGKAIIAATKKRWAAVRAAKAQQQKAASKKTTKKTAMKKAAKSTASDAAQVAKPRILINEKK
jgi:hypothetical protein